MNAALLGHRRGQTKLHRYCSPAMPKLPIAGNNFVREVWSQPARNGALITVIVVAANIGARKLGAERSAK